MNRRRRDVGSFSRPAQRGAPGSSRGLSRYFLGFAWAARAMHYRRQSGG